MTKVCVLGAGMVGLCTAWQITEQMDDVKVTVLADKYTNETTSYGAGGIFQPQGDLTGSDNLERLCSDSWSFFTSIVRSHEANKAGICVIDGYQLYTEKQSLEREAYRDFVFDFKEVDPKRLAFLLPETLNNVVQAFHYTTLIVEARRFLPWMMNKLNKRGVEFIRHHLTDLSSLLEYDNYDYIFNCGGLGCKELMDDSKLVPERGQVMRVYAPWVKGFVMLDDWTYIIPGQNGVVLGGFSQHGSSNKNVELSDAQSIWGRCIKLIPSLKNAKIQEHWVGLRPYRDKIRIEEDKSLLNPQTLKKCRIIHNYGHGTNGIGLSMGSACHAVRIALRSNYSKL